MEKLKVIIVGLCFLFWPVSLFLVNTPGDFIRYLAPALLVGFCILLFNRTDRIYLFPLLLIPIAEAKFAPLPLLVTIALFVFNKQKTSILFIFLSALILVLTWKNFWGQTIFQQDYNAQQEVISKSYLFPSVLEARFFQNKPRIYLNKFGNNFFALVDPNNYFFNFHPREILIDNQNLVKFPFLSLVFALFGFYYFNKYKYWQFVGVLLISSVLSLSILKIFDRNDFILWIPLSIIVYHGINLFVLKQKFLVKISFLIFLLFTIPQLIKILV